MKVGFLSSVRGQTQYMPHYKAIVEHLEKKNHVVEHNFSMDYKKMRVMSYSDREKDYLVFLDKLMQCDCIVAECSASSTVVGYALAHLRTHGKPIIILSVSGKEIKPVTNTGLFSNVDNIIIFDYSLETLSEILDQALLYIEPHIDKRFTIIFPSNLLAKVEEVSLKKKLPKSAFIRQLIEEALRKENKL